MRRGLRLAARACLVASLVAGLVALGGLAAADSRTPLLVSRLKDPDFRVRTSAALALGTTNDDAAITPLCQSLSDESAVVRSAAAVALRRLARPSSAGCIKARIGSETNPAVKLELTRAVESLENTPAAAAPGGAPKNAPNAKYYVAIAKVTNHTGRPQADIDRVVLGAIRTKLESLPAYQLAPDAETPEAARAVMAKRGLHGYYLSIVVEKFDYSDSGLRVSIQAAVLDYPAKTLRGQAPTSATMPGIRAPSQATEDQVLAMTAGRAAELFVQGGSW
jgi:HEAT repeats